MTNAKDSLYLCRHFNEHRRLVYRFPNDGIGVGDRAILNKIIREQAEIFRKDSKRNKIYHSRPQSLAIMQEMEEYGYRPRKIPSEDYGPIPKKKKRARGIRPVH